jgi:chromate reductase
MEPTTVLAISGSLRRRSYNTALLDAAAPLAPEGMSVLRYEGLRDLPHYDQDVDESQPPEEVIDLRARIADADGLLIATPEYNYSVPGVLKNLIDWASRPADDSCLKHKPVAILGAAPTAFGTVRAQLSLRQSFLWTDSIVVAKPEVMVFDAAARFDEDLRITDDTTKDLVGVLLHSLQRTIRATRDAEVQIGT